jgi:capsule biosynthesis phosphatase
MSHHSTTIVVDFDDTLALTLNRDWANAVPNHDLINKLNDLFDKGWTIHVVTARGQLSCKGDCELADAKYRQQIENWLYENKVKFTELSFQKKLAAYYIDDKGITPEDFVLHFNRVDLKGGLSGASIYYDALTDAVFKTAKNTREVIKWYDFASSHFNTPEIYSVVGDTIKMQKLEEFNGSFAAILNIILKFRSFSKLNVGPLSVKSMYVTRCVKRLFDEMETSDDFNEFDAEEKKLLEYIVTLAAEGTQESFCHGDFSISNIMSDRFGKRPYMIDPINDPMLLSSWMIDLAKLYMSIELNSTSDPRLNTIKNFCHNLEAEDESLKNLFDVIQGHVVGHYCRVFPYADRMLKIRIILIISEYIKQFKAKLN